MVNLRTQINQFRITKLNVNDVRSLWPL